MSSLIKDSLPIRIAIIGYGGRGQLYSDYIERNLDKINVVAVAEINEEKRMACAKRFDLASDKVFISSQEFFSKPKMCDSVFICTQDADHYNETIKALDLGYDILLEKPITPDEKECIEIGKKAKLLGRKVFVSHVLRYTPFYQKVKEILESKVLGEVVNIHQFEDVSYWMSVHGFVRGSWSKKDKSTFMLLAKCCHDLDILLWLANKNCLEVSSFGGTKLFKPECAPKGSTTRCMGGCAVKEACPYDCEKIYWEDRLKNGNADWAVKAVAFEGTKEALYKAFDEGPYGRCVYHCDNDVVDHQIVAMQLEDNVTASLTMSNFTSRNMRELRVQCTLGEIRGNIEDMTIQYGKFRENPTLIDVRKLSDDFSGHAGGDNKLVEDFIYYSIGDTNKCKGLTSLDKSISSHILAFRAEESRLTGKVIKMDN